MQRLLLIVISFSFSLLAQTASNEGAGTQSSNNPAGTAANSSAGSEANIYQNGSVEIIPRQFPTALPGVTGTPGVFPGVPSQTSGWTLWRPADLTELSTDEIKRMKSRATIDHMDFLVINPEPVNSEPIKIVSYWPGAVINPGDKVIGEVLVTGKYRRIDLAALALGLAEAKKRTGTDRVAIRVRGHNDVVTHGKSLGGSIASSAIPGGGNVGYGAAIGGLIGSNRVGAEDYPEFDIVCLNKNNNITDPPPTKEKAQQAPLPQPAPAPPAVQTVRIEIAPIKVEPIEVKLDVEPIRLEVQPIEIAPRTPAPATPAPQAEEACDATGFPEFTVYFDFDKSTLKSEYLPQLGEFATWLRSHPKCHIQVEGHTCKSGTDNYDAALGRLRAQAVYTQLLTLGGNPEQIEQFVSGGKDRPASERDPLNRRVIFRIIGPASGK